MRQPPQLIPVWLKLYDRLVALAPASGIDPALVLFGNRIDPPTEGVLVTGPGNASTVAQSTFGAESGRDETVHLQLVLYANEEGQTHTEALTRMQQFCSFAYGAVVDLATGVPSTWFQTQLAVRSLIPSVTDWRVIPTGSPRGVLAKGEMDIQFKVRI